METRLKLKPGQNGTKKLLRQYGARLLSVRYLYDRERMTRYKTVELIVDETSWQQPMPSRARKPRYPLDQIVRIRVAYSEEETRDRVRRAGGLWRPREKL